MWPVRLPSIEACHPSSGISSSDPGGVKLPPAFATRISIGPNSFSIWPRILSISANFVTSAVTGIALPPFLPISPTTAERAVVSLPCTATLAPSRANLLAIAAPIPRELPVTTATFPVRAPIWSLRTDRLAECELQNAVHKPPPSPLQAPEILTVSFNNFNY